MSDGKDDVTPSPGPDILIPINDKQIDCILVWDKAEIPAILDGTLTPLGSDSYLGVVDIYRYTPATP